MSSVYSGDHGSPPISQQNLKEAMRYELNGQTWEFPVERLAQALSAKTRKPSASLSKPEQFDTLENYDLAIDKLDLQIDNAFHHFAHNKPETLLVKSDCPESEHHRGLIDFLNGGIRSSLTQLPKDHEALYRDLSFYVWDRPMKDAKSLKPDGAGVLGFEADELDSLFWSLPAEGGEQMAIPVETRDNWPNLVLQAGTDACCLFSASPLRQFVLVIGYNYEDHTLRFLVYHRGGCTSSEPLNLDQPKGQKGFIRLLVSILTWKTRADAGFPAWCNDAQVCLLGRNAGNNYPITVDVDHILRYSICIWGRAPRVLCIKVPIAFPVDEENPSEDLIPALQDMGVREKAWQRSDAAGQDLSNSTQSATGSAGTETSGLSSSNLIHTVSTIVISRARALTNVVEYVDHAIDWYPLDPLELKRGDSAVLKLCWVPDGVPRNLLIEPRLLRDCSGMFGVPKYLYSFRAHHKANCQTTNHLFLPPPAVDFDTFRWDLWGKTNWEPEYLSLLGHVIEFAGHSLESAKDLRSLVRAVLHAHLGYYNMCQKNYQHRDLSIGNVLMVDEPIKTERFDIHNPNETQKEILDLCRNLGINDHCTGFVIDGDLAVDWDRHFTEENLATRSGTSEFMSSKLLNPVDRNHVHSPVDDYYSFFFLTQWACVFRDLSPEDKSEDSVILQDLRMRLAGGLDSRDAATYFITGVLNLKADQYGAFLSQAQQFLRDWDNSFTWINEWGNLAGSQVFTNAPSFRNIADRGLLSFLHVVDKSKLLE
ncbi:hypothetical protein F5890DRAFT_1642082 [Lentinula detonsa]|uniref:Fungal-type protein kinase domain-containing protein n=1 Tax=Lentinula detonsa TaxID=2804962 RepID=A0AA38UPJ9_9AGAR|nr:hypothetical protein F5890DRAFT_1642082 [Lentinula detonsa]